MKILIVHAHPESKSFNGALVDTAKSVLSNCGHTVAESNLYAMNWRSESGRHNYKTVADHEIFRQQAEELYAVDNDGFSSDIRNEIEKLRECDALILQFPLWWFSMPAIMKGWVDRVFALGVVYGGGEWYDNGKFAGKLGMLSVTTGGPSGMYEADGLNGDINQLLYPIQHGILRFVGFEVLPPFIAWAPASVDAEQRAEYIKEYSTRLRKLESTTPLSFAKLGDYDPKTFRLQQKSQPQLTTA